MADISITPLAPRAFRVQVRDGHRETTHQVTVPERLGGRLKLRAELKRSLDRRTSWSTISSGSSEPDGGLSRR